MDTCCDTGEVIQLTIPAAIKNYKI